MLPVYTVDSYVAQEVYYSSVNKRIFNNFVRYRVLPLYTPVALGRLRSVIILNNVKIYYSQELQDMCDSASITLAFLLAYSPNFNPIETLFTVLKAQLKKYSYLCEFYRDKLANFKRFLRDAIRAQGDRSNLGKLFRKVGINYQGRSREVASQIYERIMRID